MDQYARRACCPSQRLDDDKQIAFASLYGPLELSPPTHSKDGGAAGDAPHPEPQHLRRLQPRENNEWARRPAAHVPPRQRALAHRQLVQARPPLPRCSTAKSRPTAAAPNSPISAPPTTHCPGHKAKSKGLSPRIRSLLARQLGCPSHRTSVHPRRCRRRGAAPSRLRPQDALSRFACLAHRRPAVDEGRALLEELIATRPSANSSIATNGRAATS